MKSGVLYKSGNQAGEISIGRLIARLKRIAKSLRWAGAALMGVGLIGIIFIYTPLVTAQIGYGIRQLVRPIKRGESQSKLADALHLKPPEKPTWTVPDQSYSVYIPKINALARVVPNVNVGSEKEYLAALKLGVAEAAGLAHPSQKGTTYLFAHSTDSPINFARYNAVFYLLDKIQPGDRVEIVYKNRLYRYQAISVQILPAKDTRFITPQKDEEILVLQTCYPPGTSWKRLVVVARRITN